MKIFYYKDIKIAENILVLSISYFAEYDMLIDIFHVFSAYMIILHDYFLVVNTIYMIFFMFLKGELILTLVDRIRGLANDKGMSLPQLEIALGLGNGTISRWRNSSPNTDKLQKVADYFSVSMDYLLGRESELTDKDKRDISKDLESIMEKLNSQESGPASFDGNDIPEDDRELFATQLEAMLIRLKKINKDLYNPNKNKK